jgi:hypothetical protein
MAIGLVKVDLDPADVEGKEIFGGGEIVFTG